MPRALWLPDVFRDAGLPIELHPGWETRGSADFDPQWIIEHHDVSPAGMRTMPELLAAGRGGPNPVTGPLCNWYPLRNGVIRIVASGRANHGGEGVYPDGTTGNRRGYGSEGANNGTTERWPEVQKEAIARADAAVCRYHGWSADRVIGHKEYARPKGRKVDPSYDMDAHRRRVAELIRAGGVVITKPTESEEDDDMQEPKYIQVGKGGGRPHRLYRVQGSFATPLTGAEWNAIRDFLTYVGKFDETVLTDEQWQTIGVGLVDPTTSKKVVNR